MNCEQAANLIPLLLYDELSFEEEEQLHRHLDRCDACRRALTREQAIHEALDRIEAPISSDILTRCRRDLAGRLAAVKPRPGALAGLWSRLARPLAAPWLKPVGALALLALGFGAARLTDRPPAADSDALEPLSTQVRYLQPEPSGGVRIVLDETRQRVLTGSMNDAAIQQLLLSAARESSDPGLRVVSVDMLKSRAPSAEVRAALLRSVQSDPVPGVRLKALEGLKKFRLDPEIRQVLAGVLLSDDNAGVRIQAIDLLTQSPDVDAAFLQELLEKENNNYVRLRCEKALRDRNASVETF